MTIFFAILAVVFLALFVAWLIKSIRLEHLITLKDLEIRAAQLESENARNEAQAGLAEARALVNQQLVEAEQETERTRIHYEMEAQRIYEEAMATLAEKTQQLELLRRFEALAQEEEEVRHSLTLALQEAAALQTEAQALIAIRNVVEGYGDRYIIPTRSLLDELAADFDHTKAGQSLAAARNHSRRIVEQGQAGACDYTEENRRTTAIRFVVDAFNGRVDAILSRAKHDNCGTLNQEIQDAFSLVNLNGKAFREARVLPTYLDARLAELKWAVVVQELRLKEREEQRVLKERLRDEEKAQREYDKARQEAQREEDLIKEAMEKAQAEARQAGAEDRAELEARIAQLNQQLMEAETKSQRALSMAQQTRAGHVYIISNVGAFGEDVLKIGLTRRLEPLDRIKELGDASVPFEFDVHAMIRSDDAPTLEKLLHHEFDDMRLNKVNFRKEFFRVPLTRVRELAATQGLEVSFTMLAEAREYRETQAIERMTPEERQRYYSHQADGADGSE